MLHLTGMPWLHKAETHLLNASQVLLRAEQESVGLSRRFLQETLKL